MHPAQRSGRAPLLALLADKVRSGDAELHGTPPFYPGEDLHRRRTGDFSFQDLTHIVGQGLATTLRSSGQLTMKSIGEIPNLEHLGHAQRM
jgi:hypothetical protein